MADWLFDGVTKIISEPGTGPGDTTFDVQRDLYSAWKRYVLNGVGNQFEPAFSVEGGTPIGATGLFTGKTFLLVNGWKLQAGDWAHQATLNGNLYSDDGIVSIPNPSFAATIFVSATVGAQGIATGSGVTQQDKDDIENQIFARLIEAGFSLESILRLLAADAAGSQIVQVNGDYVIKGIDGTTDRIEGSPTANNGRNITGRDGT